MFDVLFTFFSTFWLYLWRYKRSERRKSPLSINILMFWFYLWRWKGSLHRKSIVGVLINSKYIFDVLISMFWSTKKTISTFWNFWPVDVLKFDVPTPSLTFRLSFSNKWIKQVITFQGMCLANWTFDNLNLKNPESFFSLELILWKYKKKST